MLIAMLGCSTMPLSDRVENQPSKLIASRGIVHPTVPDSTSLVDSLDDVNISMVGNGFTNENGLRPMANQSTTQEHFIERLENLQHWLKN